MVRVAGRDFEIDFENCLKSYTILKKKAVTTQRLW